LAPTPSRRRRQLEALGLVALLLALGLGLPTPSDVGPEEQVEAYYDDLDFRFFDRAHARLDPDTRPSLEQYLLQRSIEDGLIASYGKLDHVDTELVSIDGDRARVRADLDYITSLAAYPREVLHDLVRIDGRWYLTTEPVGATIPPDQFVRRATVDFVSQGRRQATTETTAYGDIIDRPEVVTTHAELVRADGRWVVIGEVFNSDVDPADVTITAQLLDDKNGVLAQYDAAQIAVHKLLPKEATAFRVEFEGIAGALDVRDPTAGPFDPTAATPLEIDDDEVAGFAVYTKAVVTGRDLDRHLVIQDARVESLDSGFWLMGRVRNDSTVEVTVPHLMLALRADDGGLVWVDHVYLEDAVRPQRSIGFRVRLPDVSAIVPTGLTGTTYDNGIRTEPSTSRGPGLVPVDGDPGFASVDLNVTGFVREVGS
jgi:hypothetical protein